MVSSLYRPPGLPVAASYPAPAQFPVALQDPRVGTNPYAGSSTPYQSTTYMPHSTAAALTSMGLPSSTGMTPAEASQQTQTALAKLAAVNPQLAQQMMDMHKDTGSGGIFGFLKEVAGTIIHPVLSMGGKILEILGRTSHIVPQWFNPKDQGNWFTDIGQALSGEDKTNWNETLGNMGILKNANWLRATIGFGLDIATDPMSYAGFLGTGAAMEAKAGIAAETVFSHGAHVETLAKILGKTGDETSNLLTKAWSFMSGQTDNIAAIRNMSNGGVEELFGAIGLGMHSEVRAVLADAWDVGAQAYNMTVARTFKNFLARDGVMRSTEKIAEGAIPRVIGTADKLKPIFEEIAKSANFTKYTDGVWSTAKAAAGAMGGARFRYAIPFTRFRYISPMVPLSWHLGLGTLSRFGAGLSAVKAMEEVGPGAVKMLMEKGWKGLNDAANAGDDAAKAIVEHTRGGRIPFVKSAFYSASEQAGHLTAHVSPGARMFRSGLGFYFERHGILAAKELRKNLKEDLFYKIDPNKSGAKIHEELYRGYNAAYGVDRLGKPVRAGMTREQLAVAKDDARLYVDYFGHKAIPKTDAEVAAGKLDDWFWASRPDRAEAKFRYDNAEAAMDGAKPGEQEFMQHQAVLDDMKRVLTTVRDQPRQVLDDIVGTETYGKTALERHGVDTGDSAIPVEQARVLNPADIPYLGQRTEYLSQNFEVQIPQGHITPSMTRREGVTPEFVIPHEDLGVTGVRFDLTGESAGSSTAAQLRVHNIVDVNMEDIENATAATEEQFASGNATLPELLKAADAAYEKQGRELAKGLHPALDNHILKLDWELSSRADLATAALRHGPNAPDGVRFFRAGKPDSMVVFDHTKVHVLSDAAPHLTPQGGYFRRTLAPELRAKLGGEARKADARLFGDPAAIELSFRRATRDMTLPEAEAYVRKQINEAGGRYEGITLKDTERVWEMDVMKGHEDYISYLGDSYFATAMGRLTSHMLALGQLAPGAFGAVTGIERMKFDVPAGMMRTLLSSDKSVQDAAIKMQARQVLEEARTSKTLADAQTRLATALAYMDAGLSGDHVPAQALASSMDGVVRSSARLQEVVAKETVRLTKQVDELSKHMDITRKVEQNLHVTEYADLDKFITDHAAPVIEGERLTGALAVTPPPRGARDWQRETLRLRRSVESGEAQNLGDGVYKTVHEPQMRAGLTGKQISFPGYTEYAAVDPVGNVVSYRDVADDGSVITQTASDTQRQGYGGRLIKAHWHDEGVKTFEDVKRVVGPNTLSPDAIKLNMWAAREVLGTQGFPNPEMVKDLMHRGELYVGKDGSILTKSLGIRKGGKRVLSRQDIEDSLIEARAGLTSMDELRKPAVRYTHSLSMESFESQQVRRELQRGAPYTGIERRAGAERIDYATSAAAGGQVDPSVARRELEQAQAGHDQLAARLHQSYGKGEPVPKASLDELERRASEVELANRRLTESIAASRTAVRDVQAEQAARGGLSAAEEAARQDDFAAALLDVPGLTAPPGVGFTHAERAAAKRFQGSAARAEAAVGKTITRSEKASFKRGEIVARAHAHVASATAELNRALAESHGIWADMKPAVMFDVPPEGGMAGLRQVQVPGMGGLYAHPYVAEEMEQMFRGKPPTWLSKEWRQFVLGPWKRWATYRNPGFHVRNFFGAWFNHTLGGGDGIDLEFSRIVQMAIGSKKEWATKAVSDAHWSRFNFDSIAGMAGLKGRITYGDVGNMLSDMGIGRANTTSVAATMGGEGLVNKARGTMGEAMHKIDSKLRNAGGTTEGLFRVASWATGMRHTGGDLYGSRAFSMLRHGDYGDLTPAEDFIRDIVPFYKWMRINVPYQFRMMAENPGLMTAITDKAQAFAYDVQGLNRQQQEAKMPEWMKRGGGFLLPIPKGTPLIGSDSHTNYLMFDLPYSDLYNGARDYLSASAPVIRNIIESYGLHQSFFTGAPLGSKMVPLSGIWANPVMNALFKALPFSKRGPDGQTYIPDTLDNVLSAIPLYSRFRNWMLADPARVQNRMSNLTSWILGVGIRPEDATAAELAFYNEELVPAMDRLRSMGYTFPTAQQLHDAGSLFTNYGAQPTSDQAFPTGVAGSIK